MRERMFLSPYLTDTTVVTAEVVEDYAGITLSNVQGRVLHAFWEDGTNTPTEAIEEVNTLIQLLRRIRVALQEFQ